VAKHGRGYVLGVTSGQQLYWPHHRTVAEIANDPKSGSYPVAGRPIGTGEARRDGAIRSLM
jgi:hypothetical protein